MKAILLTLVYTTVLFCTDASYAQNACSQSSKGISTHPDNPRNTEKPTKLNTFDWRTPSYYTNATYVVNKNAHTRSAENYPYYNEIMGVFNLVKTPVVHFRDNYYSKSFTVSNGGYGYNPQYQFIAQEKEFRLNELKYAVNPAAGLGVQEIRGSLIFKRGSEILYITPPRPIGELGNQDVSNDLFLSKIFFRNYSSWHRH